MSYTFLSSKKFNKFPHWLILNSFNPSKPQSWTTSKPSNFKSSPVPSSVAPSKTKNISSTPCVHRTTNYSQNQLQGPKAKTNEKSTETTKLKNTSTGTTNILLSRWIRSKASNIPKLRKWIGCKISIIECSITEVNSGMATETQRQHELWLWLIVMKGF